MSRSNEFEKKVIYYGLVQDAENFLCLSSIVANYDPEKAADISTLFDVGGIFGNLRRVTIFLKETQNAHSISANIKIKIPV